MNSKNEKLIYALMVLTTLFWAGAFIAGKFSVNEFPLFSLTFFRFAIASVMLFIIMISYEKDWKINSHDIPVFIALGIIGIFGYHILFFMALKHTSAINSSLIAATNPLMTAILASFFLGDKLNVKKSGAILLSLTGVFLTITGGNIEQIAHADLNSGDLLMLAAAACMAVYSVISKKVSSKYSPMVITTYSFIVCSIVLIPFMIFENPGTFIKNTTFTGWAAVIYMAIFPSLGYLIQQISLNSIGPRRTSVFINLVPVFSIILSILILNETMNPFKLLSSLLIVAGVYLTSRIKS